MESYALALWWIGLTGGITVFIGSLFYIAERIASGHSKQLLRGTVRFTAEQKAKRFNRLAALRTTVMVIFLVSMSAWLLYALLTGNFLAWYLVGLTALLCGTYFVKSPWVKYNPRKDTRRWEAEYSISRYMDEEADDGDEDEGEQ